MEPGFYDVTLTVTDENGSTNTDAMLLTVFGCDLTGLYTQDQLDQAVAVAEAAKDQIK